jgi:hypothetical protein
VSGDHYSLPPNSGGGSPMRYNRPIKTVFVLFLCLPRKKKNQKEKAPVSRIRRLRRIPCASRNCREFANSHPSGAQTVQTPFSAATAMLGACQWGTIRICPLFEELPEATCLTLKSTLSNGCLLVIDDNFSFYFKIVDAVAACRCTTDCS